MKSAFYFYGQFRVLVFGCEVQGVRAEMVDSARKLKVGVLPAVLIEPFSCMAPFSSLSDTLPLKPPCLYSPSKVMFS